MALFRIDSTQIRTMNRDGSSPRWLGSIGHVSALKYGWAVPGGCDALSCTLMAEATLRTDAVNPGRLVQGYRGGSLIWEGILQEPVPTAAGWSITATGAGTYGTNFVAYYTSTWPAGQPDQSISNAIGRGMRWANPGVGSPGNIWLGQGVDPGAQTITDLLNLCCTYGSLTWFVKTGPYGNILSVIPLPTVPTRQLVATTPVARTIGAAVNTVWERYEISADTTSTGSTSSTSTPAVYGTTTTIDVASAARYGPQEVYVDLSQAGVETAGTAQAVGQNLLNRYQRASWAGPFTVNPRQLLTMGGQATDIGMGLASGPMVCQLLLTDYAYGGEVSQLPPIRFLVGAYEYDDDTHTATITPFQYLDESFSGIMSATTTMMPTASSATTASAN